MEGNVGVWASRFLRLSWLDNGEAAAEGQPPPGAFPKAFARLKGFCAAYSDACADRPG
jgi:hypothetical protein